MNTKLSIQNTTWYVKALINNIDTIIKPKFQRKSRWLNTPDKNNKKPSFSEYIKFLFKTENSVDPISFGIIIQDNIEFYVNIDGNNRLNAIMTFIKKPLVIFKYELSDEIKLIKKYIPEKVFNNLDYNTLSGFRRLTDIDEIIKYIKTQEDHVQLENIMIKIQKKLLLNKSDKFTDVVKLNINIFKNGKYEDYNDIFSSINKHSNELSENDLLASLLFSKNINISDNSTSYQIIEKIKNYYNDRDKGEILSNDVKITLNTINIFDYMLGLQNCMKDQCKYLKEYSPKGSGYIFRIYKIIEGTHCINPEEFNNFNYEEFTKKCLIASKLLNKLFDNISNNYVNEKIFGKRASITSMFRENSKMLLLISIISMINSNKQDEYIISCLSITCFYHVILKTLSRLVSEFNSEENKLYLLLIGKDKLQYQHGGGFIDSLCRKIINNTPEMLVNSISSKQFEQALTLVIQCLNKPSERKKASKRTTLNLFHKILFNVVVRLTTPIELLNEKGVAAQLQMFGEGIMRSELEAYVVENNLL